MMRAFLWALSVVVTAPLLLLLAAGIYWLWSEGLILAWVGVSVVSILTGWLLWRAVLRNRHAPRVLRIDPAPVWSGKELEAWRAVEAIARRFAAQPGDTDSAGFYSQVLMEVVESVASHYHPHKERAILELHVPHLLRVVELMARDLRIACSETVPGSHLLTVNDFVRGGRLALRGGALLRLYRSVVARDRLLAGSWRRSGSGRAGPGGSSGWLKQWLVDAYVRKLGYYAIELYSGRLLLDDRQQPVMTSASRRDLDVARERDAWLQEEPLRIVVIGAAEAGKSSLVNALLATTAAAVASAVPKSGAASPYVLEREGFPRAILIDTPGYEVRDASVTASTAALDAIVNADLVVLVCSAIGFDLDGDRRVLAQLSSRFEAARREAPPPIVVALTHVDRLRPFREWAPPYDTVRPEGAKARSIRAAMEIVAQQLAIGIEHVVPVNVEYGRIDNVEEGLLPVLVRQLDAATRLKCSRCLQADRAKTRWRMLWRQSTRAGRFVARQGVRWLGREAGQ